MADRKHLLHVKSNVAETAKQYGIDDFLVTPKKPVDSTTGKATDDTLLYGEIAVNYGKGVEALTIRNTEDNVVAFVNENDFYEAGEIAADGLATEKLEREEADATEKLERVDAFNYLNNKIDTSVVSEIVSTTYAEIKSLREQSKLKAGQFYRITDYVTTTTQKNTQSAGHVFDVIVLATDVDTLNENAKVIKHEGDTYFVNSDLDAWEIKYDLDNDITKYAWADETNGKGVIYYMKDEWNNECPYDFKNILFLRDTTWFNTNTDWWNSIYYEEVPDEDKYYYTFTWVNENKEIQDCSIVGNYLQNDVMEHEGCHDNKICSVSTVDVNLFSTQLVYALSNNIIVSSSSVDGGLFYGVHGNTFNKGCCNNTLGDSSQNIIIGNNCSSNRIDGSNIKFGNGCSNNTIFNCNDVVLLDVNNRCKIGNCYNIYCGLGNYQISIGSTDRNDGPCHDIKLGSGNNSISIPSGCSIITIGDYCYTIELKKAMSNIIIESGNKGIDITSTQTPGSNKSIRNFTIAQGVNNTTNEGQRKTISHNTLNDTFQTIYKPTNSVEVYI